MDMRRFVEQRAGIILIALVLATGLASAAGAVPLRGVNGAVTGNKHDFSKDNTAAPIHSSETDQVCIFCHTPHGATAQSTLWNRPAPAEASNAYERNLSVAIALDANAKIASGYDSTDHSAYPNGSTRLCMSCHDGVTAIGAFLVGDKPSFADDTMNLKATAVNLATAHPVSFKYDADVVGYINTYHGSSNYGLPQALAPTVPIPLDSQDRMQCTTCHDPHEDTQGSDPAQYPFWRHVVVGDYTASYDQVCAGCHIAAPGLSPHP